MDSLQTVSSHGHHLPWLFLFLSLLLNSIIPGLYSHAGIQSSPVSIQCDQTLTGELTQEDVDFYGNGNRSDLILMQFPGETPVTVQYQPYGYIGCLEIFEGEPESGIGRKMAAALGYSSGAMVEVSCLLPEGQYTIVLFHWMPQSYPLSYSVSLLCGSTKPTHSPTPTTNNPPTHTPTRTPTQAPTSTRTPTPTDGPPPTFLDTDGDGIPDELEHRHPILGQSNLYLPDSDGDGLPDGVEDANRNGQWEAGTETLAMLRDTDQDGYEDGVEVLLLFSNPVHPNIPGTPYQDRDQDCLPDEIDPDDNHPDTDGDRYKDGYEAVHFGMESVTHPAVRPVLADVDQNGVVDNADAQILLAFFAEIPIRSGFAADRSDADRNGRTDNADTQQILNFFAYLLPYLPVW